MPENRRMNIDHADSPELQNYFAAKDVGDECEFTIKGRVVSTQPGMSEVDIESVEMTYEDEDLEVLPTEEEPLAIDIIELSEMEMDSEEEGMEPSTDEMLELEDYED